VRATIDRASFKIDAAKHRRQQHRLHILVQLVSLLGRHDVAFEKDCAGGLDGGEHRPHPRRHLGAVEADDHQLSNLLL
jgi:hypothetical protein